MTRRRRLNRFAKRSNSWNVASTRTWLVVGVIIGGCGSVESVLPDAPGGDECTADTFIACDGDVARSCNASGTATIDKSCGGNGCNALAGRCNACVPDSTVCGMNSVDTCGANGLPVSQQPCALGCVAPNADGARCRFIVPSYGALDAA